MKHLKVKNFGPVRDAELDLKEYNFLIGGQGVGKSTLAKLLSIVSDYNLYLFLSRSERERDWSDFLMDYEIGGYIKEDSYIEFQEDGQYMDLEDDLKKKNYSLYLHVERDKADLEIKSNGKSVAGKGVFPILVYLMAKRLDRDKWPQEFRTYTPQLGQLLTEALRYVLYIPAERIMYTLFQNLLPALNLVKETVTRNMLYFSIEYNNAKSSLKHYSFPFLGVDFEHEKDDDYIILKDKKHLSVKAASSGMQSTIPLLLTLDYALKEKRYQSYVIEEPECNLFPKNQIQLMNSILHLMKDSESSLTITTHSPYIINYLNLLMRRWRREMEGGIQPEKLSVYLVNDEGETVDLMSVDNQTGETVVNTIDLSETMGEIYSEYIRLK